MFSSFESLFEDYPGFESNSCFDNYLYCRADDEMHAIRLLNNPALIGWITLQKDYEGRPDLGIKLFPEFQNQGYGPEAVALFANHLHYQHGLPLIYVRIYESNAQSQRAFSKLGAVLDYIAPDPVMAELYASIHPDNPVQANAPLLRFYHLNLPLISETSSSAQA